MAANSLARYLVLYLVQLTFISELQKVSSLNVIDMTVRNSSNTTSSELPLSSSIGKISPEVKSNKNSSDIHQKLQPPEVRENCPYCVGSACSDCIPGYIWDPKTLGKVFVAFALGTIGFLALFFFYRKWSFVDIPFGHSRNFGDSSVWILETAQLILRAIEEFNY